MKYFLSAALICVLILQASGQNQPGPPPIKSPPKTSEGFHSASENGCPPFIPAVGCTFDPANIKCKGHSDCSNGQLCCSEGCGKICKDPAPTPVHPATKP